MKRFLVLLLIGVAAAFAIWFAMRGGAAAKISSGTVTGLLPKETLAFVHVPDLNRSRAEWHETELYKLWREPAVQEFLRKPLTKAPQAEAAQRKFQELEALEIKDAFFAVTSWENKQARMLAGFQFKGTAADAEKVLGQWRVRVEKNSPGLKRETVTYEQHQIEMITHDSITIATAYDGNWFFAANDVPALKTLIDRTDGRLKDAAGTLAAEENFIAASKHMPANYVARAYAKPDRYFEKLAQELPKEQVGNEQLSFFRRIRSLSAAMVFEKGKMRDVTFIAMPELPGFGALSRESLNLAPRDTFLYVASFLNLPKEMPTSFGAAASGLPMAMQQLLTSFAEKGVTLESWKNTFGQEFGAIGQWDENARLPSLFATLPVKDAAKANEIVAQVIAATEEDRSWTKTEKDGVQYFSQAPMNPMVPFAPAIGLSNQRLVLGHDVAAMESVFKRSNANSSELAASEIFKSAERLVPAPKFSFSYIDTAMLYARLDAALRPMLIMAAAFVPSVAETVDLGKLPQAEVITKHLGPIVMSQNYENDGYLTESVGPVSIYPAAIGIAAVTGVGTAIYQGKMPSATPAAALPSASPTPEESEDEEDDSTAD